LAKAQFHRHQRVWVEAVGAWATIDRLIPVWSKGFDEPVRITYDVGLGREFTANELLADTSKEAALDEAVGAWRILRARNKWQEPEDCGHHPLPGTFPVVVTDPEDWGGWRVPGAEYDRAPYKIEHQARLIACSPQLLSLARELLALATEAPDDVSPEVRRLARGAKAILSYIGDSQTPPGRADPGQGPAVRSKQAKIA
jgi:hypothetical protein